MSDLLDACAAFFVSFVALVLMLGISQLPDWSVLPMLGLIAGGIGFGAGRFVRWLESKDWSKRPHTPNIDRLRDQLAEMERKDPGLRERSTAKALGFAYGFAWGFLVCLGFACLWVIW